MTQFHLGGRRNIHRGGEGWTWVREWKERGRGEHDQVLGCGNRTETLRTSKRMERGKLGRQEVGGHSRIAETWEVRDSQDSKGGTLDEMPHSGELVEPTSSRKTGHQVRDGEEAEENGSSYRAQIGIQLKGRHQLLTLLLRVWCAQKRGPIIIAP